jgi:hypothetical protein
MNRNQTPNFFAHRNSLNHVIITTKERPPPRPFENGRASADGISNGDGGQIDETEAF